jgi:MoxR-like ATPase
MSKAQRHVFLSAERGLDNQILLVDANGSKFLIPDLNMVGTAAYKRAVAAVKYPDKWFFKVRVVGNLTTGTIAVNRVPANKYNVGVVENFNKPAGGLEAYMVVSTPNVVSEPEPVASPIGSDILGFIHNQAVELKPKMLFMSPLKWKYLIRNIIRGKNIMMTGPAGCGKTMAAKAAASSIDGYAYEIFNLGSTQDPRATLIGNTQFDTNKGTVFNQSPFVKAIQKPNTVIILDEITRAHPEAWNILMTVLDPGQRYLRLDEAPDAPIIKVADGVSFIASANIGNEYTATRQLDRAIIDRFTIVEMETLSTSQEYELLSMMYPTVNPESLKAVSEISTHTRNEVLSDTAKISNSISTRASIEIASLLYDGFRLDEAAEITIYPLFDEAGGAQSERTYIKQFVQKFVETDIPANPLFGSNTDLENPF